MKDEMIDTTVEEHISTRILRALVSEFVMHPENLEITERRVGKLVEIRLRAHLADTSRVIGEGGAHFRALARLVSVMGARDRKSAMLHPVLPATVGERERYPEFRVQDKWPGARLMDLAEAFAEAIFGDPAKAEADDYPEGRTLLKMLVGENVPEEQIEALLEPVQTIWKAIGKRHGRTFQVHIFPSITAQG